MVSQGISMLKKTCSECQKSKSITKFDKIRGSMEYSTQCIECEDYDTLSRIGSILDLTTKSEPQKAGKRPVKNCRGGVFPSVAEAARTYNVSRTNISKACNPKYKRKSSGKYKDTNEPIEWSYVEPYKNLNQRCTGTKLASKAQKDYLKGLKIPYEEGITAQKAFGLIDLHKKNLAIRRMKRSEDAISNPPKKPTSTDWPNDW